MELPTELRLKIFEYVIAPQGKIYPLSKIHQSDYREGASIENRKKGHVVMGTGYQSRSVGETFWLGLAYTAHHYPMEARKDVPPADTAHLYVKKQVHQEALQAG